MKVCGKPETTKLLSALTVLSPFTSESCKAVSRFKRHNNKLKAPAPARYNPLTACKL